MVVEVKNTDWDRLAADRIRPNLRTHIRQLQHYLDSIVSNIGPQSNWDSAAGVLLYPKRPRRPEIVALIDLAASNEAIMVVWHDENEWGASSKGD